MVIAHTGTLSPVACKGTGLDHVERQRTTQAGHSMATKITTTLIKSVHGPTYKVAVESMLKGERVHGETLPVHVGLDVIDAALVGRVTERRIHRGEHGRKVPYGMAREIDAAILACLKAI